MELINTITGISMSESLTKTLLDKWNQEPKINHIGKESFPDRWKMEYELKKIRENQLTHYLGCYGDVPKKKKTELELFNAYKCVFNWEEEYSVETEYEVIPTDNIRSYTECENFKEAQEYLNDEKDVEEPSTNDWEGWIEIGDEEEKKLIVRINNLRLKEKVGTGV